ncbi:MAG: type I restriction enzyme HsdR N-terminal domain-containing protein [Bacteroidota bacterium]|nr:type I restriction enzyme HsdR N-terminal domain-containing protein [Bacteroidota bacterium]
MATLPQKIQTRIIEGLKRFQPIVESAKTRDVNESDTVVLLTGILSEILGYDKYTDITTELAIRGTFCDLALKIDGKITILLEAKAIGIELKEQHVKQAVDYAANKGIEWVILTNSVSWRVYKVIFSKPIQNILVLDIDFLKLRPKSIEDIELFFEIAKEAVSKSSLEACFIQKQATNKFMIGNILYSEAVVGTIKKELKFIYPDIKVSNDEILNVLTAGVVKREIIEGEEADEAKKKIAKAVKKKEKIKTEKSSPISPVVSFLEEAAAQTEAGAGA